MNIQDLIRRADNAKKDGLSIGECWNLLDEMSYLLECLSAGFVMPEPHQIIDHRGKAVLQYDDIQLREAYAAGAAAQFQAAYNKALDDAAAKCRELSDETENGKKINLPPWDMESALTNLFSSYVQTGMKSCAQAIESMKEPQ